MKSKYFPLLVVLIIGVFIVLFPSIMELFQKENIQLNSKTNPTFQKIAGSIKELDSLPWDYERYNNVLTDINAAYSAGNLQESETNLLLENLNGYYVPKLVSAAENFYNGACNDKNLLSIIGKELQRYSGQDTKATIKDIVKEMRETIAETWNVVGYSKNGIAQGIDGKILSSGVYDKATFDTIFSELIEKSNKKYLNKCSMVKESVARNRKRLDEKYFEYVEEKIIKYLADNNYEIVKHRSTKQLIDAYVSTNYLGNRVLVSTKAQSLYKKMDEFYKINNNKVK